MPGYTAKLFATDAHRSTCENLLAEKLDILRSMLHGFDYSGFLTGGHKTLAGAANYVLGLTTGPSTTAQDERVGKKRFADIAKENRRATRTGHPADH